MIPYGRQEIIQQDIDAVVEVLKSDFLTQGPKVPIFENSLISHTNAKYATVVNSATSALHIACRALDLGHGDWLWTSPISFVASANAGLYCGANVDFVDIDPQTYNLCSIKLQKKLENAALKGTIPKVLIAVHLAGQSCDMIAIHKLCSKYGIRIIEDASHAIGGTYNGKPIGSCDYSDITVFSFHPVKIVTTAEGGAALTNDIELSRKLELYRTHGITRDQDMMTQPAHGDWYYEQIELGYNYRMTELQAALGIVQMTRLKNFVATRHRLAKRYDRLLANSPVKIPFQLESNYSAFHLYVIRLSLDKISVTHRQVFEELRANNIGVNIHYIPIHMQPFYKSMGFKIGDFPEAEKYYSEAISLPMYTTLSEHQQDIVVEKLISALSMD